MHALERRRMRRGVVSALAPCGSPPPGLPRPWRDHSSPESAAAVIGGVSIDTRTLRAGDVYVAIIGERLDGHRFVGEALRAGASGLVVSDASSRAAGPRSGRRGGAGRRHDARPAAPGEAHPARVGRAGGGDHRERREDDDERNHRRLARGALPRVPQPGQLQQPHRAAALVARTPPRARDCRCRAGDEPRGRDPRARGSRRARRARLDAGGRGPLGVLRVAGRHRRRQGRDSRRRHAGFAGGRQRRRPPRHGEGDAVASACR